MIQVLIPNKDAEFIVASLKMSSAMLLQLRNVVQGVDDIQRMIDAQEKLADQLIRLLALDAKLATLSETLMRKLEQKEVSARKVYRGEDEEDE